MLFFCRNLPQDLKSKQVFCALRKRAFKKWTFYWSAMVKKNGSSFNWASFKSNEFYSFLFIFTVIIKSAVALLQFPFIFIFSAKSSTDSRSRSAVHRREMKTKLKTFSGDESLWQKSAVHRREIKTKLKTFSGDESLWQKSALHRREIKTKLETFSWDESSQLWPCS